MLRINDEPVTVAGVLPASFDMASVFAPGSHFDLYFPFPLSPETNRWGNTMAMIGRLKPGVAAAGAQAELKILAGQMTAAHPERNNFEGKITPLAEHVSGRIRPALLVLVGAVGVVMLIVCANLSNMLLARTAARQKEIAIRTALGAGRGRADPPDADRGRDSLVLRRRGWASFWPWAELASWRSLEALSIPLLRQRPRGFHGSGVLSRSRRHSRAWSSVLPPRCRAPLTAVHDVLKDTTRGTTEGKSRNWIRSALVVSEIAFACVLLVGAGLLIRSFLRVLDVNLGFRPEHAATVRVDPDASYSPRRRNRMPTSMTSCAAFEPSRGLRAAGLTDDLARWGAIAVGARPRRGRFTRTGKFPNAFMRIVTDGYREAMGITLVAGRDISERDTPGHRTSHRHQ